MYFGFQLISVDSIVGPVVSLSLAKELAPVLTGLIVAGKAGSSMAAQIGTMKVTEQIDVLEVMGINAHQYLAVPRIGSSDFVPPYVVSNFFTIGNFGSYVVGTQLLMIDEAVFICQSSASICYRGCPPWDYWVPFWVYHRCYWNLFWFSGNKRCRGRWCGDECSRCFGDDFRFNFRLYSDEFPRSSLIGKSWSLKRTPFRSKT